MEYRDALLVTAVIAGIAGIYSYCISQWSFWTAVVSIGFIVFLAMSKVIQIMLTKLGY